MIYRSPVGLLRKVTHSPATQLILHLSFLPDMSKACILILFVIFRAVDPPGQTQGLGIHFARHYAKIQQKIDPGSNSLSPLARNCKIRTRIWRELKTIGASRRFWKWETVMAPLPMLVSCTKRERSGAAGASPAAAGRQRPAEWRRSHSVITRKENRAA